MFIRRQKIVMTAFVAVMAAMALVTQIGASGSNHGGIKLEAVWIGKAEALPPCAGTPTES